MLSKERLPDVNPCYDHQMLSKTDAISSIFTVFASISSVSSNARRTKFVDLNQASRGRTKPKQITCRQFVNIEIMKTGANYPDNIFILIKDGAATDTAGPFR